MDNVVYIDGRPYDVDAQPEPEPVISEQLEQRDRTRSAFMQGALLGLFTALLGY